MSYYIHPIWFYLISVGNTLKFALTFTGVVAGLIGLGIWICYTIDIDEDDITGDIESIRKRGKKILIGGIILINLAILIPSEKVCIEMLVASQVTHENVEATVDNIKEVVEYVCDRIDDKEKD